MSTYTPQPGSVAQRAVDHLKTLEPGLEVTSAVLAEAIDTDATTITMSLKQAVAAGQVRRRTKPDNVRLLWWSVGDGRPVVLGEQDPEVLPHRTSAPDVQPQPGSMFPGGVRGNEEVPAPPPPKPTPAPAEAPAPAPSEYAGPPMTLRECAEAEEKPAAARPFDAWLSGVSGELVLQGVEVDADGDAIFAPEKVAAIRRVLLGAPA